MAEDFFPERPGFRPQIYAYADKLYNGLLKVGYTTQDVAKRVAQQYPTLRPGEVPYSIVYTASAIREDGTTFMDFEVHRYLRNRDIKNPNGEWFECEVDDVAAAVLAVKSGITNYENRTQTFKPRPSKKKLLDRQWLTLTFVKNKIRIKRRTSCGMPKCDLVRPLRHMSLPKEWDLEKF